LKGFDSCFVVAVITVESQNIDIFVARITFHINLSGPLNIGRIGIKQVVHSFFLHKFNSQPPKLLVFFVRAKVFSPPEPTSGMFVPRTEYDRYFCPVFRFQRIEKISSPLQPMQKFIVILSIGKNAGNSIFSFFYVPCVTICQRIIHMPTHCNHSATLILTNNFLTDFLK